MTQLSPTPLSPSQLLEAQLLEASGFDLPLTLAVIAGLATLYSLYLTLRPLMAEGQISTEEWERMEDESIALINRRDRLIDELKDLEFEAEMNKLEGQDLSQLRSRYEAEALAVIAELDERAAGYQAQIDEAVASTLAEAKAKRAARQAEPQEPASQEPTSQEPTSQEPTSHEPPSEESPS